MLDTNTKKIDILAIGIHPDDVELSASGTLIRHAALGYRFGILDLTEGELGTRGTAEIRREEALNSAKIMGAQFREILTLPDGFMENNRATQLTIITAIRKYQPDIILTNALSDRHPDHGKSAKITADACFLSGLEKIETRDESGQLQSKWRPKALYHYIQDNQLMPDFVVDITPYFEQKMACILAFRSQFFDPESQEPETPISSKNFLLHVDAKCRSFGRNIGTTYAEGFNIARVPGVNDLFDLK